VDRAAFIFVALHHFCRFPTLDRCMSFRRSHMKTIAFALALATLAPLAANAQTVSAHDRLVAKINAAYHTQFKTSAAATAEGQHRLG
jgi:hypothetical protein